MFARLALTGCLLSIYVASSPALAAVPTALKVPSKDRVAMATTLESLELPLIERVQDLRAQGSPGYANLRSLMFDRAQTMQLRWKAVTAAGRVGGEKSRVDLERAYKAPEWYMRNAALISMMQVDRSTGLAWARRLLADKALVVRAAAVDAIANANDATSAPVLWEKLYSKENYKRGQSLFIRRRIVEALAHVESPGREAKFIAVLADKDGTLHEPAIAALERITKKSIGQPGEPVKFRKAKWEKWWKETRTL